jgi:hypothetical protein
MGSFSMSLSSPPLARVASPPSMGPPELSPALHERIVELVTRLRSENARYERAAQSWTDEAVEEKRQARKAREGTLHEIEELLAHSGEVDRLARLERLPCARKLAELEAWIEARPAVQEQRPPAAPEERRVAPPAAAPRLALLPSPPPENARVSEHAAPPVSTPASDRPPDALAAPVRSPPPTPHLAKHGRAAPAAVDTKPARQEAERSAASWPDSASTTPATESVVAAAPPPPVHASAFDHAPAVLAGRVLWQLALPQGTHKGRAPALARMKTRAGSVGAALVTLVLAVGGWRALHRSGKAGCEETAAGAAPIPVMVAAVASASPLLAPRAEPPACPPLEAPVCPPSAEPPAYSPPIKRAASPSARPPPPKPSRLTWPSVLRNPD